MATIDSKKLLPQSKKSGVIEKQKFLVPLKNVSTKKITGSDLKPVDKETTQKGDVVVIKNKVIKIKDLIKNNYLLEKKKEERQRKTKEKEKFQQKENKLESKVKGGDKFTSGIIPVVPGGNILDRVNRFIGFTLLGYIFNNYAKYLPKLIKLGTKLTPALKFFESFAKIALDATIGFIDLGYKAYDSIKKSIKDIGGENYEKLFTDFSANLNTALNIALIAAGGVVARKTKGLGGTGAGTSAAARAALTGYKGRTPSQILTEGAKTVIKKKTVAAKSVIKPLVKVSPELEGVRTLVGVGGKGPGGTASLSARERRSAEGIMRTLYGEKGGIPKAQVKPPAPAAAGKGIMKGLLGSTKGMLKMASIPVIGALVDYIISTKVLGEKPNRAAASAIGSGVGSLLGTAATAALGLGTGGIGAALLGGAIIGGASYAGSFIGTSLYDMVNVNKRSKFAQGGQVSGRGKKPSRSIKRTITKKPQRIQPQKTDPGKNIGGKLKIEELYGKDEPGKRSALRALKKSSEDVKKMRSLNGLTGSLFGAGIDMALGQKPDKRLASSLGNMFGSVVQTAIDSEMNSSFNDISRTLAMANGGVVPSRRIGSGLSIGEKIGRFISNALAVSIEGSATRILQNLNRELNLEGGPAGGGPGGGPGGPGAGPMVSSDSADFWLLSLISLYENSNPQGAADVAQSIYNRMGYSGRNARQIILARNQYEPVGKFGSVSEWNKVVDKESALNHIKKYPGNAASASGLEKVAATLLDKSAQQNSAKWVGNRPDFRSESYEKSYDDMTDDISRNGQTFGFNRGSAYKGKSPVAQRVPSLVKGTVSQPVARGNVLSEGQTVVVEGNFRLRQDAAQAYLAMKDAAKKDGVNLTLESAWRDSAKQKILYEAYLAGRGNLAAPPGSSNHERGIAIDLRSGIPWAQKNCTRFGWSNTGMTFSQKEPWHFDYVGGFVVKDKKDVSKLYQVESKNKPSNIFDWNQSSVAPSQSSTVAALNSGILNTATDALIIRETHFVLQKEMQTVMA